MSEINRTVDSIILGHNPFFGVDHLSQERGNEKAKKFEDISEVTQILHHCHDLGVRGMMMSTHPRATAICESFRNDTKLSQWRAYPLVPYIQKYVRGSNEKGLVNLVIDTLGQATMGQKLSMIFRGGVGFLAKDVKQALTLLIDVELLPFKGVNMGAVFLHDTLTDLALGLGLHPLLDLFRDHVEKTYGVQAGFVTKNLPMLRRALEARGWRNPLIMASFNSIGFYVNPSLEEVSGSLKQPGVNLVAMNTLASGKLNPEKAYKFLSPYSTVKSVVVGVSRKESATQTINAIKAHMPQARHGDG